MGEQGIGSGSSLNDGANQGRNCERNDPPLKSSVLFIEMCNVSLEIRNRFRGLVCHLHHQRRKWPKRKSWHVALTRSGRDVAKEFLFGCRWSRVYEGHGGLSAA